MVSQSFRAGLVDLGRAHSDSEAITHAVKELRNAHLLSLSESRIDPVQSMAYSAMLNGYRKVKDHAENIAESLATKD